MQLRALLLETFKSGTIAAFAMPLAGTLTKPFFGGHVWQYGKKVAELYVENPTPMILLAQSLIFAWAAALLLLILLVKMTPALPVVFGAAYGLMYYMLTTMSVLPLYFGDPLPWNQGPAFIIQPLIVHVVFGACVALISRRFVLRNTVEKNPLKPTSDTAA
jgi:uncharacterized membrane protein YagU involved in acid resistance